MTEQLLGCLLAVVFIFATLLLLYILFQHPLWFKPQ